jgi:hypothetical protein
VVQSSTLPTAPGGVIYSANGTYTTTIKNSRGCDSVLTTTVTYSGGLAGTQSLTICQGNIVYIRTGSGTIVMAGSGAVVDSGGVTYSTSGTYTTTIQNAAGCDLH